MKVTRIGTQLMLLAATGLAAAACGTNETALESSATKITGGQNVPDAQQDERRWSTVALTTEVITTPGKPAAIDAKHSFCSGTLVAPRVVMTAAHCIQKMDATTRQKLDDLLLPKETDFLVHFDATVDKAGTWVRAVRAIPHPDWDPKGTLSPSPTTPPNDIGIIILESDAPAKAKVADLLPESETLSGTIKLAGYGVTRSRDNNDTGVLRQVDVPLNAVANEAHRFQVGQFGRGACAGDSGGPAYYQKGTKLYVIGATSTGAEFASMCLGLMNNYTDVRFYKQWITDTARQALGG